MAPDDTLLEEATREEIDKKLALAGWVVQDKKRLNLYESLGVAVREMDAFMKLEAPYGAAQNGEVPLGCTDTGPADYMLFIDGKACGIIEAKREGKVGKKTAEESMTNSSGTNVVALQCAAKRGALWRRGNPTVVKLAWATARNKAPRFFDKLNEIKKTAWKAV